MSKPSQLTLQQSLDTIISDLLVGHYAWAISELEGTKLLDKEIEEIDKRGDEAKEALTALFTQALTSLKREMEKNKKTGLPSTEGLSMGQINMYNYAISECQRVIELFGKEN